MSLHTLANHMSAHGRGPDSTLVHMSPREVQGLQALAMRHGGSLTINPQTGLPEAGILENLLPAIAGFALNAFAPGVGGALGSALGFGEGVASTVGTGLLVGGATGLATGSLEKGLMAGLGGYGGAGLGSSLLSAGDAALAGPPVSASGIPGAPPPSSPVGTLDRLQAGVGVLGGAPTDFMKSNLMNIGLASAPVLMDSFGNKEETLAPKRQLGNRYMYRTDPETGQSYAYKTYTGDEIKDSPPVRFGGAANGGLMQHYDAGGSVSRDFLKEPVKFGGVTDPVDINGNPLVTDSKDTRSDSQKAHDYLMGKGTNPFLFYGKAPAQSSVEKASEATKSLQDEIDALKQYQQQQQIANLRPSGSGSGLSMEQRNEKNDPTAWSNLSNYDKAQWFADNPDSPITKFQQQVEKYWPLKDTPEYEKQVLITQGIDPDTGTHALTSAQRNAAREAIANPIAEPGSPLMKQYAEQYGMYKNPLSEGSPNPIATVPATNQETGDSYSKLVDSNTTTRDNTSANARGGFLNNGRFDQRYAHGGGITALAQGGMYNLGSYSDGGRLLRGPGDGVSDDIPATIGQNQPARLADGEFVVPARIVSELGNGSTEAGARKLYAMMDRVQKARSKTVGKDKVAANSRADKYLPA